MPAKAEKTRESAWHIFPLRRLIHKLQSKRPKASATIAGRTWSIQSVPDPTVGIRKASLRPLRRPSHPGPPPRQVSAGPAIVEHRHTKLAEQAGTRKRWPGIDAQRDRAAYRPPSPLPKLLRLAKRDQKAADERTRWCSRVTWHVKA